MRGVCVCVCVCVSCVVCDDVGRCNKVVTAQKQLTVDRAPPILVVQLKRFDVMSGGGKINKTVTFREQLDIAKVMSEDKKVRYPAPRRTHSRASRHC